LLELVEGALRGKKASHRFDLDGDVTTAKQMVSIGG
jgi:hypothetical protein